MYPGLVGSNSRWLKTLQRRSALTQRTLLSMQISTS